MTKQRQRPGAVIGDAERELAPRDICPTKLVVSATLMHKNCSVLLAECKELLGVHGMHVLGQAEQGRLSGLSQSSPQASVNSGACETPFGDPPTQMHPHRRDQDEVERQIKAIDVGQTREAVLIHLIAGRACRRAASDSIVREGSAATT